MYTKQFSELTKDSTQQAGGKGASLGEMYGSGIPVPNGFVVLSATFDKFIKENLLDQKIISAFQNLQSQDIEQIDKISQEIQTSIMSASLPNQVVEEINRAFKLLDTPFVAVRSSATAEDSASDAWAGQLDSFLNTTEDTLIENIKKCWASLFTPRAIFYRIEKGLVKEHISVAVVVQKMVKSEIAGIAFSIHPLTQDKNNIVIDAALGLGEAIVSGQITPDNYIVQKEPLSIINKSVKTQTKLLQRATNGGNEWQMLTPEQGAHQVLSDKQIAELAQKVIAIEKYFGFAVDIEWAYENNKLFILQSRPITTSKNVAITQVNKEVFTLAYTRDRSVITQESWYYGHAFGLEKLMNVRFKHRVPMILYYNDGPEDIWNNESALSEIYEKITEKNKKEPFFVKKLIEEFNQVEKDFFKPIWMKQSTNDVTELAEVAQKFYDMLPHYSYIYYTLLSESADKCCQKEVEKWKEKDVFFDNTGQFFERSIEKIYPELSFLTKYILIEEIKNPPSREELSARRKNWIYVPGLYNEIITLDDFSFQNPSFVFQKEVFDSNTTLFYGQTASVGGIFKGKARLLRSREEMHKVENGDIIVAPMTIPEFLPAMKRASAFVNDEGGMLSHAAVVAREMKKPCIVDTKFATQVIKDGDELEINADNGMVRILKKSVCC